MKVRNPNAATVLDLALAFTVKEPALRLAPELLILHIISKSTPKKFSKAKLGRYLVLFYLTHPLPNVSIRPSQGNFVVDNIDELLKAMEEKEHIQISGDGHSVFKIMPDAPRSAVPKPFLSTINGLINEWDDRRSVEMIREVRVRVREALQHIKD
jgi:hypothetical protein